VVSVGQGRSDMSVGSHRRGRPPSGSDAPRRSSRLRVRDWRVGTKLAAVLVVPSVAFLVLAGLQTSTVANRATVLDEFAGQVGLSRQATALIHELQLERDRTLGELAALGSGTTPGQASARLTAVLQPIHRSVDGKVAQLQSAARGQGGGSAAWRSALSAVNEQLNQLDELREGVLDGGLRGVPVSDGYTRIVGALLDLLAQPSPGDARSELNQPVLAYVELARAKEVNSLLRGRLFAVASAGRFAGADKVELSDLRAQQLAALAQFRTAATDRQVELYERTLSASDAQEAGKLEEAATAAAAGDVVALDPAKWWSLSTAEHDLVRQVESQLVDDAVRRVDRASSAQWRQTVFVAALILLVLLAAMAASVAIGRSMARSLRQLRGQALGVAQLQLPRLLERLRQGDAADAAAQVEAPTVRSADEIGDVAEAFHAVHRSAVHLAVEQAAMRRNVNAIFVNLARRSQVLVERQLELLDRLERGEGDPDQLANLFQLDHLAARMRRNDDNLLVLAGSESARRWTEAVALSTVVLAAVAEIEQYPRVQYEVDDALYLVGPAVGDLAHLLAELLENATMFSPPHGAVVVTGGLELPLAGGLELPLAGGLASGRAAVIEIADGGIGMSPRALAEANEILAKPPLVDVAVAERMGLVVVSHLAARHGIRVQLRPASPYGHPGAASGGLVATVWLPPELLAPVPVQPDLVDAPTSGIPALIANMRGNGSRRPAPAAVEARPGWRGVPTRAEDVLGAGVRARSAGTAWWSRPTAGSAPQPSRPTGRLPQGPPEVPVTGGLTERGLPMRVPMAQLPAQEAAGGRAVPAPRADLDPEAVGSALARFYGGVRQAQAEETGPVAQPRGPAAVVVPVFRTGIGDCAVHQRYEEEQR
jgi:Nitrate and nitrite sensing